MKEIKILVNPHMVEAVAGLGNDEAKKVLAAAMLSKYWIRSDHELREVILSSFKAVESKSLIADLDLRLPAPSDELLILVAGINTDVSNILLLFALKQLGYNAKFDRTAGCAGRTEPPASMLKTILEVFPDFFD